MGLSSNVRHHLKRAITFLSDSSTSLTRYVLLVFPLALLPSLVLVALSSQIANLANGAHTVAAPSAQPTSPGPNFLFLIVVAPLFETIVLRWLISLARKALNKAVPIALVCGLVFGLVHAMSIGPLAFLSATWGFFVFATAYLAWERRSRMHAFVAAAAPHALANGVVFLMMHLGTGPGQAADWHAAGYPLQWL